MKIKSLTLTLLFTSLLLAACNQADDWEKDRNEKEKITTEKPTTEKPTKDEVTSEDVTTELPSTELESTEEVSTELPSYEEDNTIENPTTEAAFTYDVTNVTDQVMLENIIFNTNYTEAEKVQAYNSAVANGVIPQGIQKEGYAADAYQSSIAIQNGVSYNEQMRQRYQSFVDQGLMTIEEMNIEVAKLPVE